MGQNAYDYYCNPQLVLLLYASLFHRPYFALASMASDNSPPFTFEDDFWEPLDLLV